MKLFKKENLEIRTTQEPETKSKKPKWLALAGTGLFIMVALISLFFVDGTLLPSPDDKEYTTSKTVILPMVDVSSLNPLASKDEDTYFISKLIYDSLFALDEHLTPVPILVDQYIIDKKSKSISITLRNNIVWHDGKPFTSADVKYSVDAFKAAGSKSVYQKEISKIDRAKIDDASKVTVYFNSADEMSLNLLTFPILPKHQFERVGDAVAKTTNFKPIGTGAYAYKSFDPTDELLLVANSKYFGQVPQNELAFRVLPNKVNFFNLLKASNLSLIISKSAGRESEISGEDVTVVDFPSNELEFMGYNFTQGDLSKRSVRSAIAYAINPQELIDESYFGSGVPSGDLYFPGYLDAKPQEDLYAYSVETAEASLKQGGYTDQNGDGIVENAEGDPLTFRILVNSNNPTRLLAARQIKDFLKEIGIQSTVEPEDWNTYLSRLNSGDFDLYLGGMQLSQDMDLRMLLAKSGQYNYIGYTNGKLDGLLDDMRMGHTPDEMLSIYLEIREIIHDDMPYLSLLYKTYGAIKSPALSGEVTPSFHNYYKGCEDWYCRYETTDLAVE